jgi:hypothetical protein
MRLKVCYILMLSLHPFNHLTLVDAVVVAYTGICCGFIGKDIRNTDLSFRNSARHLQHLLLDSLLCG